MDRRWALLGWLASSGMATVTLWRRGWNMMEPWNNMEPDFPICSNMFQYVPICSNMFQYVPICSNMFQYVPICSNMFQYFTILALFWPFGVGMVSEWSRNTLAVLVRPSWSLPQTNSTVRLCNDRFHWVCFEHELQPDGQMVLMRSHYWYYCCFF